jgi:hypothetical protein
MLTYLTISTLLIRKYKCVRPSLLFLSLVSASILNLSTSETILQQPLQYNLNIMLAQGNRTARIPQMVPLTLSYLSKTVGSPHLIHIQSESPYDLPCAILLLFDIFQALPTTLPR